MRSYRKVCCLLPTTLTKIGMLHICMKILSIHIYPFQCISPKLFAVRSKEASRGRQSNTWNLWLSWGSISQIYIRNAPCNPFSTYPIPIPLSSPFPKTIEQDSYLSPSLSSVDRMEGRLTFAESGHASGSQKGKACRQVGALAIIGVALLRSYPSRSVSLTTRYLQSYYSNSPIRDRVESMQVLLDAG